MTRSPNCESSVVTDLDSSVSLDPIVHHNIPVFSGQDLGIEKSKSLAVVNITSLRS